MRRLLVFIGVSLALLVGAATFNWWVDPFAEVWKPGAVADARAGGCLVSQELIGIRYPSFKLDVFAQRPTRRFVVGSSRVLEIASHPGERSFANLGYPGTAPETILKLFRALPAKPVQTVYVGVEAFWLNGRYAIPDTDPSAYHLAEYLLSRSAFTTGFKLVRQAHYILSDRWRKTEVGARCVIGDLPEHQLAPRRLAGLELGARPEALPEVPSCPVHRQPRDVAERVLRRLALARRATREPARAGARTCARARMAGRRLCPAGASPHAARARHRSTDCTALARVSDADAAALRALRLRVGRARGRPARAVPGKRVPGRLPQRPRVLRTRSPTPGRGRPTPSLA